ncbi:MAG: hypothetical protein HDR19_05910 [Lachnospiraceae bacterium]|nr:hypothetical protein [Lachnospiraceae bacterium]
MKKGILAIISYVIVLAFCGCEEIERVNEELSSELSSMIGSYENEQQMSSEESEPTAEIAEIYYAYHKLDKSEQNLYRELLDALSMMAEKRRVSTLDSEQLDRVFECVLNDHPELFYVEGFQYTEHFFGDTLTGISFEGTYSMTKEEAELALDEIEQSLSECMKEVPLNEDEYSTVKYLYEYLIDNTEYDKDADNNQNIRSVFLGGRSVCQGYAKAMQYMLQKVGIQSFLVTGYTGAERHAWNLVRVNGKYYYLDPTWGDASYSYSGSEGMENAVFLPPINYDYFLVTTNEITRTHSFEDLVELPSCESTEDNYYVREGLYFERYDVQQLENIFDSESVKQEDYVTLKCADTEVYHEMLSAIIEDRQIFGIIKNNEGAISYASNEELCTISFWNIFY